MLGAGAGTGLGAGGFFGAAAFGAAAFGAAAFRAAFAFGFAFLAYFAMIASRSLRLRIRFANATSRHLANAAASPAALETRLPANASGAGPPVAQSTSSTV